MVCAKRAGELGAGMAGGGGARRVAHAVGCRTPARAAAAGAGGCAKAERSKSDFQLTAGCMCSNSDKAAACPARCRRAALSLPMPATCRLWGLGAAESRQEGREGP